MYNLHLSAEQLEIRDTVRDFVAQEVKPRALAPARLEARERPLLADVLDKASQLGLRMLALSEELGGAGADTLTCCIVTEELALEDRINEEVRVILEAYSEEMRKSGAQYAEMFKKVKTELVRKYKAVL